MQRAHTLMMGVVFSIAALLAPPVLAHATVVTFEPANNAELAKAPAAVVLTFNEDVEASFSSIVLQDATGKAVANPAKAVVDAENKRVLKLAVPTLASGGYIVRWVAVGPDGHRRTGQYQFSVK